MAAGYFARLCLAGSAVLLLGINGQVLAQAYIGAGAGLTASDLCNDIAGPGVNCDDEDTGLKLFGGYKFTPNFAAEAAWVDLGEVSASGPGGSATVEADGFQVAALGMFPINPQISLFGKLGAFMWDANVTTSAGFTVGDDGTDIMLGFGGMWNITQRIGLRAEWERFDVDSEDVDFLSVGVQFNF